MTNQVRTVTMVDTVYEVVLNELHKFQLSAKESKAKRKILRAGRRGGKALDIRTPILTTLGWRDMGDLYPGDFVFSETGRPVEILAVSEVFYGHRCYKVCFNDGSEIVADEEHLWAVEDRSVRRGGANGKWVNDPRKKSGRSFTNPKSMKVMTTLNLIEKQIRSLGSGRTQNDLSIPTCQPLQYPHKDLLVDPYLFGAWLGDGHSYGGQITTEDPEIVTAFEDVGYEMRPLKSSNAGKATTYGINVRGATRNSVEERTGSFIGILRKMGVAPIKRIPDVYLTASVDQRIALLQGLMDTDGSVQPDESCEFMVVNEALANGVLDLLVSLGVKARIQYAEATLNGRFISPKYRIYFIPPKGVSVFRLPRKAERQTGEHRTEAYRRYIVDIQEVESVPTKCIYVDNPTSLYLAGRNLIITHNTVYASDETVDAFLDGKRVLYAVPTGDQLQKWWFEVCHALQPLIDAKVVVKNESNKSITRPGTKNRIRGKTAWDAQTLRGDYADVLILDELQHMSEDTWDEVGAPMLLDNDGDAIFIFTPPSIKSRSRSKAKNKMWVIDFWRKHSKDTTGRWETFVFSSFDNPYISRVALDEIIQDMTNLAYRQEIMAEAIDQAPGALWTREELEKHRCALTDRPAQFTRIGVAVDPSLTEGGDEAGILVGGIDALFGHYFVLQDASMNGTPLEWAKKAILVYFEFEADYIILEKNAGGEEMLRLVFENAAEQLKEEGRIDTTDIRLVFVNASRGKQVRADPVSAMYERGIVHHVGNLPDLEDELCVAAGTLISTSKGQVPIEDVQVGDFVMTREGYKRVLWSGITGEVNKLAETTTRYGRRLLTTISHPIYNKSTGLFCEASDLKSLDKLEIDTWHINRWKSTSTEIQSSGMVDDGSSITGAITWTEKVFCSIEKFGSTIMAKYQTDVLSIIKTITNSTTPLKTLNWLLPKSILPSIPNDYLELIGQPKIENEYPKIELNSGKQKNPLNGLVDNAGRFFQVVQPSHSFAHDLAREDIVESMVVRTVEKQSVYNLTIEDAPEYFANGILVHNCLWTPTDTKSPNRLDAVVWLMTMLKSAGAPSEDQMRAYANAEEMRRVDQARIAQTPGTQTVEEKPNPEMDDILAYLNVGTRKPQGD